MKCKLSIGLTKLITLKEEIYKKSLKDFNMNELTLKQLVYLKEISARQEATSSELAEFFNITKPTVTIAINTLEKSGYLCRRKSETDKRVNHILLTEKGNELVLTMDKGIELLEEELSKILSQEEIDVLGKILNKI